MGHMLMRGVTVKDRILLHLLEYWGLPDRGEWPPGLTQSGIAAGIGVTRGHVAGVVPELVRSGHVEVRVDRVRGRSRRMKVYMLTTKGGRSAGELARSLLTATMTVVDDTGEWDIPLDGLVQLHKVDMLTALASIDEQGRIDLRELHRSRPPTEDETGEEEREREALEAMLPPGVTLEEIENPARIDGPEPKVETIYLRPWPQVMSTPHNPREGMVPPPAEYWNPVRKGTGRKFITAGIGFMMGIAFMLAMAGVVLVGLGVSAEGAVACYVAGFIMLAAGVSVSWSSVSQLWALGERRVVWITVIMCCWGFLLSTVGSAMAWGPEAILDMLWVASVMGLPTILLAAGAGHMAQQRATFMLIIGPLAAIAFLITQLTDPHWAETPARAVLGVEVGASWAFVGLMIFRVEGWPDRARYAYAGMAMGVALVTTVCIADDLRGGRPCWEMNGMFALWAATAAWAFLVLLVPRLSSWRPPTNMAYPILVFSGAIGLIAASLAFFKAALDAMGLALVLTAVAMVGMVSPEIGRASTPSLVTTGWGGLLVGVSVLVLLGAS